MTTGGRLRYLAHEAARRCMALAAPDRCPFCDTVIRGGSLCHTACHAALPFLEKEITPPAGVSELFACCEYDGAAREALLRMKAGDYIYAPRLFGVMIRELAGELFEDCEALVPVPCGRKHAVTMGYVPALVMARQISLRTGVPVVRAISPSSESTEQKALGAAARAENARRRFVPSPKVSKVAGKRVVLIDDISTTGSTIAACADILRKAGAADVKAAVFAKTQLAVDS